MTKTNNTTEDRAGDGIHICWADCEQCGRAAFCTIPTNPVCTACWLMNFVDDAQANGRNTKRLYAKMEIL